MPTKARIATESWYTNLQDLANCGVSKLRTKNSHTKITVFPEELVVQQRNCTFMAYLCDAGFTKNFCVSIVYSKIYK